MRASAFVSALAGGLVLLAFRCGNEAGASGVSHLGLVVSEIMYQPLPPTEAEKAQGFVDARMFEFIELTNITSEPVPLRGLMLRGAVNFSAEGPRDLILEAHASAVLAADADAFGIRYLEAGPVLGEFSGELPDEGGRFTLTDGESGEFTVGYGTGDRWPKTARGMGFSLTLMAPAENPDHNVPAHWRASATPGGSPGAPDPEPALLPIYINEILPQTKVLDTYYRVAAYPRDPRQAPTNFIRSYIGDMQADPYNFSFIHFAAPDLTGHLYGWGSPQQDAAITAVDVDLGEIFALIDSDARLMNKTAILLTTDHGGGGGNVRRNHTNNRYPLNYTIHFHVWGPGVPAAGDLYELNSTTRLPPDAEAHPPYSLDTSAMPIRNGDLGNLALSLLGLPPIPGSWINHDQSLRTRAEGVEFVIAISVDGLRPESIRRLGEALPHLNRLRREGAFTDQARTDTLTYTNPNHTTMLTGRGTFDLSPSETGHSVTFNTDVPTTLHAWNGGTYIASVFDVLHAFGKTSAFYSNKIKLDFLARSYGAVGGDAVEFYNPNAIAVNIGGWGLTDDPLDPQKFTVPKNTVVPSGGYLLLHEDPGISSAHRPFPLETFFGSTFSLSTAGGELHLFSAAGGALTGYDTGTSYGGILEGMSLGLLESGDGFHYGMTRTPTPGAPNTAWLSSPLILTEFYFPESAPELAFVELRNVGTGALLLGPEWGLRGSFSYTFPASGLVVESGQIVLLARDPGELQASGAIREDVALLGPLLEGTGNPVGEIELKVVTASEPLAQAAHVAVLESVTFAERASWIPPEAPLGHSLQRRNPWAEAALPENWRLSQEAGGSPGEIDLGTYGLWRELSFSGQDPDALDPLADPDGDRSLNLEEYAFGTDPLDSDSFHRPSIARTGPPGQASIELRYQRPADIADVIYEAEISSDMNTWRTVTQPFLESAVRTPLDGGFEEVLFTAIMPAEARFIRIKLRMLP